MEPIPPPLNATSRPPAAGGTPVPARRRRVPLAGSGWTAAAVIAVAPVMLPVLIVLGHLALPLGTAWGHLAETTLPGILGNTAILMGGVALGAAMLGAGTAWLVTWHRFPGSRILAWALLLPMAMPAYIIGYAYTDLLAFAGPVQTALRDLTGWTRRDYGFPDIHAPWGATLMLVLVLYPYVFLLARASFLAQSSCLIEAGRTLGRGPGYVFWRVALPLARPAIAAGTALAVMEALADFGTVQYFGVNTFTTAIYRTWFGMGDRATAAQLAAVLLLFALALLTVERLSRGQARYDHGARRYRQHGATPLRGGRAALAMLACLLPPLLGFLLPAGHLLALSVTAGDPLFGPRFLGYAGNSLTLAALAAVVTVALALLPAYAQRLSPGGVVRATARLSGMGYAVPGAVIAVGILIPFGAADNALDAWLRSRFGVSSGLLLSGGIAALIFAYAVRFLAVALHAIEAGLAKITPGLDGAARTLGAGPGGVLVRVHAPLLRGSVLTASLLVFVEVMKELPATLIIRPFDFDTLAVRVYQLAADERLAQASTGAITIVAVGLVPVILLSLMIARTPAGPGADRSD